VRWVRNICAGICSRWSIRNTFASDRQFISRKGGQWRRNISDDHGAVAHVDSIHHDRLQGICIIMEFMRSEQLDFDT
jgi:hypothetical protein